MSLSKSPKWSNIKDKPTSSTVDIDDTVTKKHSHTNASVLNDISDSGGSLAYKGNVIGSGSGTSTGDMLKSIYDTDNNGYVS